VPARRWIAIRIATGPIDFVILSPGVIRFRAIRSKAALVVAGAPIGMEATGVPVAGHDRTFERRSAIDGDVLTSTGTNLFA
jgi:hypothetical protein